MNELIKQVILDVIIDVLSESIIDKIILFGSRARNDYNSLSDYDVLVILEDDIQMPNRINLSTSIRKQLAQKGIDADIIIKSKMEAEFLSNKTGSIVKSAIKEGVVL